MRTRTILAVSLGLCIPFLVTMALVTRFFVQRHTNNNAKQDIYSVDGETSGSYRLPRRTSSWKQLFTPKQREENAKWLPTLSGIIKAGDEGLWSSSLFANPHGHPGEVSFEAICEMFANELRPRSMTERSTYSGEIGRFIIAARRGASSPRRVQSVSYKRGSLGRGDATLPAQRKSLDISSLERGLGRSLSVKKVAPVLIPVGNGLVEQDGLAAQYAWTKDGRPAEYHDGRMAVKLTPAELTALSIILGSSITPASSSAPSIDKGAFGISIRSTPSEDGRQIISLHQHKLSISQTPPSDTGYSPLYAKHLACSSLPISHETNTLHTLLITSETLIAIRSGTLLAPRKISSQSPQAKLLISLPTSRPLTFQTLVPTTHPTPTNPLIPALASLPFNGGLTLLASPALTEAIHFIASGGHAPGRLLPRLEALVDKVQRHTPQIDIFGPLHATNNAGLLFRERERVGRLRCAGEEEGIDTAARVGRYTVLLRRLMALVPARKEGVVKAEIEKLLRGQLERGWKDAVLQERKGGDTDSSATDLGKAVESLLKQDLPFKTDAIALVARLVLVAWSMSVRSVAWGDGEQGWRVPVLKGGIMLV